jgi:short-subunit dehydrogenase
MARVRGVDRPSFLVKLLAASHVVSRLAVFGATSLIAQEYCRILAARGETLFLVGRNTDKLSALSKDLTIRGAAKVVHCAADLEDLEGHPRLLAEMEQSIGECDVALIAHGVLPDQKSAERDFHLVEQAIATNFTSVASLCELLAARFEARRAGTIAVISSVAGDRARASAYFYNATKAALDAYLTGLRHRLDRSGVLVITIKPGLVDTPMTAHLKKTPLFASAGAVARGIDRAIQKRRAVVYVPGFWRWIMFAVRMMPEPLFKRMNF